MSVSAIDVQKAYLAYFGRPADPGGLAYWQTGDATTMKAGFAASAEYATMYAGMIADQRVEQVYQNLLGRSSDPDGKAYWVAEFNAGRQTVSSLVDAVQAGALNEDITTINNRVSYATSFSAALDTQAEIAGYSGNTAAVTARGCVSAIHSDSASLSTAMAGLTTSVASVVGVSPTSSSTSLAGQAVIDLGSYGNLINPVQVDNKWYYYWDRSGDGTCADSGTLNGGMDQVSHDVLDTIFTQDLSGVTGGNGNTTDTYRYATLNGVRVALPTQGDGLTNISNLYRLADNQSYTDLAEIWDTYNSGDQTAGMPSGWMADDYWSATPSAGGYASLDLRSGIVLNTDNTNQGIIIPVALEVWS